MHTECQQKAQTPSVSRGSVTNTDFQQRECSKVEKGKARTEPFQLPTDSVAGQLPCHYKSIKFRNPPAGLLCMQGQSSTHPVHGPGLLQPPPAPQICTGGPGRAPPPARCST
eukprot:1161668-Pelagomonas_calceolata.AAC.2